MAAAVKQPAGTAEVRLPRLTSPVGAVLQFCTALWFASYFFFGLIMVAAVFVVSPAVTGLLSWRAVCAAVVAYLSQLALHKPHVAEGWPRLSRWFLYSPFVDYVLHYHDSTCVREGPAPDPAGKYLFAVYPHGVYGVCRAFSGGRANFAHLFPGIHARWGSFGAAFYIPGVREFSLLVTCLDASRPVLQRAAARGESISLLPGGIDEMALTDRSKDTKVVMEGRKGYARLAIENGMDIVPGFCFGEKWLHHKLQLPPAITAWLRSFRISGTLLKGRGPTFLGALGVPLGFVWAEPVRVRQQCPADPAYVDEVHAEVEAAVRSVFERYKVRFGYAEDETLTVVAAPARAPTRRPGVGAEQRGQGAVQVP